MSGDSTLQPLLAAILCVGLAVVFFWLRRKGFIQTAASLQRRGNALRVIERVHLTPQHSLHLVNVGTKTILVAASPSDCRVLDTLSGGGER
jgi:flagellar biogenesis protein FliO